MQSQFPLKRVPKYMCVCVCLYECICMWLCVHMWMYECAYMCRSVYACLLNEFISVFVYESVYFLRSCQYSRCVTNTSTSHSDNMLLTASICMTRYRPNAFFSHCVMYLASVRGPSSVAQMASMATGADPLTGHVSISPTRKSWSLSGQAARNSHNIIVYL